jgi:hypothetical protein
MTKPALNTALAFACLVSIGGIAPANALSLSGETISGNITISGSDDNGPYNIPVFSGLVPVPTTGDVVMSFPVLKQLTLGGFATASNQILATVTFDIGPNTISVTMSGQVQPFELESMFSGIGPTITNVTDSATGLMAGVNMDLFHNFTPNSVDFATFYLGFQPGTDVTQTETLAFSATQAATPLPAAFPLFAAGTGLFGLLGWRKRKSAPRSRVYVHT